MKKVILSPGWVTLATVVLAVDLPLWRIHKNGVYCLKCDVVLRSYVYFLAPRRGIDNFRGNAFIQ